MVSGGCESDALQEFHLYYLLVCVLVDWALSERALVFCLTEDMLLFLFVYLPASTLFLFFTLLQPSSVSTC